MQEIGMRECEMVGGGPLDFTEGGVAVIALGLAGTVATAGFGLAIGGAMLLVGYYENQMLMP